MVYSFQEKNSVKHLDPINSMNILIRLYAKKKKTINFSYLRLQTNIYYY